MLCFFIPGVLITYMRSSAVLGLRGQSAIEYLMTYGWAILVILGLGVVLWKAGILNVGKDTTPGQRGFSQVTPIDWKLSTGRNLSVRITNEAGVILNLTNINATLIAGGSGACTGTVYGAPLAVFRPAQSVTVTISNCPVSGVSGDYFQADVGIIYTNPSSGIDHLSFGKVWGPIES